MQSRVFPIGLGHTFQKLLGACHPSPNSERELNAQGFYTQ
jgi:hypothetical protein